MTFEIGKCYRHSTGIYMSIVGEVETTMWGTTLVAEATHDNYGLVPVGKDPARAVGWEEVTEEEWTEQFEPQGQPRQDTNEST